jgi:hypothetical protein
MCIFLLVPPGCDCPLDCILPNAGGEGGVSADPASILSLQSDLAASSAGWEAQARMLRADIQVSSAESGHCVSYTTA